MKRCFIFLIVICLMLPNFTMAAAAAEEKTINVTFNISDDTKGALGEDLTIILVARNSDRRYEYVVSAADGYPVTTVSVAYGYTYDVGVTYPSKDTGKYHIISRSGGEIISAFDTSEGDLSYNWLIIEVGGEDMPIPEDRLDEEAPVIWSEFEPYFEMVTPEEPIFNDTFNFIDEYQDTMAEWFEAATGRAAGDWYRFTPEEQYRILVLYVLPYNATNHGASFWGEPQSYVNYVRARALREPTLVPEEEKVLFYEAKGILEAFCEWNWLYYRMRGELYSWDPEILNRFYTMPETTAPTEAMTAPTEAPVETTAAVETVPPETEETVPSETEPEGGVKESWHNVWQQIARNWLTIILLLICGGLLLYIKRLHIKKNVDE